jgi:DNA/RNA-binding domain of Phe-tRNA-synthetase-like protein
MDIHIHAAVRNLAPGITLGIAKIDGVSVAAEHPQLAEHYRQLLAQLQQQITLDTLSSMPSVRAVREMYKLLKVDPSRYRPASEAMLRRVLQGKGLPAINTAVDVNNMGSLYWGIPSGIYNASQIKFPVELRLGLAGEEYGGITGSLISAHGKLVLADQEKIIGSPTTDSYSTRVEPGVTTLMLVQYIPAAWSGNADEALAWSVERLLRYNGGTVVWQKLLQ